MKDFIKKYFLIVADKPFKTAGALVLTMTVLLLLLVRWLFGDRGAYMQHVIIGWAILSFIAVSIINILVAEKYITYFFMPTQDALRRIILIRTDGGLCRSYVYRKPIWSKVPYVEIYFPEDWNLRDESRQRQIELGIFVPIDSDTRICLTFATLLNFNGDFQALDLEEMIRQQGANDQNDIRYHFKNCLQRIVANFFRDNKEIVKDSLSDWQRKRITTKELESRLAKPELIFGHLFVNIDEIKMVLCAPELIYKNLEK